MSLAGGIIAGAGAVVGATTSAVSQGKLNKKTRKWNEKMWQRNNEYNDPAAQRARLEAAGLNPHLIYGNNAGGASGNSGAPPAWNPTAPDYGAGISNAMSAYADIRQRQVQTDLLKEQVETEKRKQLLDTVNANKTISETARTDQEVKQAGELFQHSLQGAKLNNDYTLARIDSTLSATEQNVLQTSSNLQEAGARILKLRAETMTEPHKRREIEARIKNLNSNTELMQIDARLKNMGINPNDPAYMRIGGQLLQKTLDGDIDLKQALKNLVNHNLPFKIFK